MGELPLKNDPANGGGRISEDNKVALARNGKPSKAYRESLHVATRDDMERLVAGVLSALVAGENTLLLKTPYIFKWPKDFPVGNVKYREGRIDYRLVNVRDMLAWLNEKGYTTMTPEKVRALRHKVAYAISNT